MYGVCVPMNPGAHGGHRHWIFLELESRAEAVVMLCGLMESDAGSREEHQVLLTTEPFHQYHFYFSFLNPTVRAWMSKVPHRLMCWNAWLPAGGAVLGYGAPWRKGLTGGSEDRSLGSRPAWLLFPDLP